MGRKRLNKPMGYYRALMGATQIARRVSMRRGFILLVEELKVRFDRVVVVLFVVQGCVCQKHIRCATDLCQWPSKMI